MKQMLAYEPKSRLTIEQIKQHAWYTGEVADKAQVMNEFQVRKSINDD